MMDFNKIQNIDNAAENVIRYSHAKAFINDVDLFYETKRKIAYHPIKKEIVGGKVVVIYQITDKGFRLRSFFVSNDLFALAFEFVNIYDYTVNVHIGFVDDKGELTPPDFWQFENYLTQLQVQGKIKINKLCVPENTVLTYDGSYDFIDLYKKTEPRTKYVYLPGDLPKLSIVKNNKFFKFCRENKIQIITRFGSGLRKNINLSPYTASKRFFEYDERTALIYTNSTPNAKDAGTLFTLFTIL